MFTKGFWRRANVRLEGIFWKINEGEMKRIKIVRIIYQDLTWVYFILEIIFRAGNLMLQPGGKI